MILLAHAQEAVETHYGKHDVVGLFVQNDVFDLTDLFPVGSSTAVPRTFFAQMADV